MIFLREATGGYAYYECYSYSGFGSMSDCWKDSFDLLCGDLLILTQFVYLYPYPYSYMYFYRYLHLNSYSYIYRVKD